MMKWLTFDVSTVLNFTLTKTFLKSRRNFDRSEKNYEVLDARLLSDE